MWSKYGSRKKASREKTLSPQPVSGTLSPNNLLRTPFAILEESRRSWLS
jgi:hypothetical protein